MVSSHPAAVANAGMCKSSPTQLLLPKSHPNVALSDHVEVDFSDVFGPLPGQPSNEVINGNSAFAADASVTHSLKLSKPNTHETEDSVEGPEEPSVNGSAVEDPFMHRDDGSVKMQSKSPEDFEIVKLVGRGAFGKVFQVRERGTSEIYAMKVIRKDVIVKKNYVELMKVERDILTKIDHPFIVHLKYSFQTKHKLYLVLDFLNGGQLSFILGRHGLFREDLARIYTAELVSALSHLHANGIMHRDLKLENILLDADGHVILTDFGMGKQFEENARSGTLVGTVEYMAPEVILGKGYYRAAEWWSVGIMLFEMLTGKLPFDCRNRQKYQQKILMEKIKLPAFLSSEAHSLLKGLLQKDPCRRLGHGAMGGEEIKSHKWFKPINWKKLEARVIQPSFRPDVAGVHCIANFDRYWTDMPLLDTPISSPKCSEDTFQGYSFVRPAAASLPEKESSPCE